jgi:hypothetical protein
MIHELVVTSAARGLQAGRSGFTTVLRTRGIHPELQSKLEQGSAYRHVYPQGDARNPRILSHALLQSPAGQMSVLSSIVDAGNGYDGRSNKLAHHLALDGGEVSARAMSSPASVLMALDHAGGLLRRWSGQPREQPAPTIAPPAPACEPKPCNAWARVAGDAGWAGVIVERALRREQTWIIAAADCELIELFAEALSLVPPAQRWGVTFTTYAVGQPDMLWLGTVDGSPEAQAARGQSRVAVVDLVRKPPLTAASALVDAARGKAQVPWQALPAGTASGGGAVAAVGAAAAAAPGRPPRIAAGRPGAPPPLANPFAFSTTAARQPRAAVPAPEGAERGQRRSWVPLVVVALATAVIVALIALVVPGVRTRFMGLRDAGTPPRTNSRRPGASGETERPRNPSPTELATDRGGRAPIVAQPSSVPPPLVVGGPDVVADSSSRSADGLPIDRRTSPSPPPPPPPPLPPGPPRPAPPAVDAFPKLCSALDSAEHLPIQGLDSGILQEQTARLCALHGARVRPQLPDAVLNLAPNGPQSRVSCVPTAEGDWRILCSRVGAAVAPEPIEVGRLAIRDDTVCATLNQRVAPNDPRFSEHLGARAAVATAIVILADEEHPQQTTHVQLCRPTAGGPIVVEQFFFDDKLRPQSLKHTPVKLFLGASLPSTPWQCQVRFEGTSVPGGLAGRITTSGAGYPSAALNSPASWTIEWSTPAGKPVMKTELQLANKEVPATDSDPCDTQFWLQSSDVLEPWNTFRFCADLNQAVPPRIPLHQLPRVSLLKIGVEVPADSDHDEVDFDLIKKFSTKVCRQYPKAPLDLGQIEMQGQQPVSLWKERIRGALAESAEYRDWTATAARGANQDVPSGPPTPRDIAAYWSHLKSGQDRTKTTHPDVALCCLLEELDMLPPLKQQARSLIEALGEGDAEFRGDVAIDFGNGRNCVLLVLGDKPPTFVSARKPEPTAQRDKPKVQRPAAPAIEDRLDVPPPVDR